MLAIFSNCVFSGQGVCRHPTHLVCLRHSWVRTIYIAWMGHIGVVRYAVRHVSLRGTQYVVPCVPQFLGPLLYTLYTADLTYVVERHGICLHQYADDSQVYMSVSVSDVTTAVQRLADQGC